MNASLLVTQFILYWTLLGILVIWMLVFAVLAFRSHTSKHTFVAEPLRVSHPQSGTPTAPRLSVVVSQHSLHPVPAVARSNSDA